jgi:hypothetical protein
MYTIKEYETLKEYPVIIDKKTKNTIFLTINNKKYFINIYGVLGKYSILDNGKKWYTYQLDFDNNSANNLIDKIFTDLKWIKRHE